MIAWCQCVKLFGDWATSPGSRAITRQPRRDFASHCPSLRKLAIRSRREMLFSDLARRLWLRVRSNKARELLIKALGACFSYGSASWNYAYALEALGYIAISQQIYATAARLLGVTQAYHERFQNLRSPKERDMRLSATAQVRSALGEEAFRGSLAGGGNDGAEAGGDGHKPGINRRGVSPSLPRPLTTIQHRL